MMKKEKLILLIIILALGGISIGIYKKIFVRQRVNNNSGRPFTITHIRIKKGGKPGFNCDYTSITAALLAIDDNSSTHRYELDLANGVYNAEAGQGYRGLELKNFVDIVGQNRDSIVIAGIYAPAGLEKEFSTINRVANCTVKNVSIYASRNEYCVRADQPSPYDYIFTLENCTLDNRDPNNRFELGIGMNNAQKVIIKNCIFRRVGINVYNARKRSDSSRLEIIDCKLNTLHYTDDPQGNYGTFLLSGNTIKTLLLDSKMPANKTEQPAVTIINENNKIDSIAYLNNYPVGSGRKVFDR
ncbi:MAG TPA: hypothetical protein VN721_16740 [Flavipsychrobacter sp.]|nr:hypothetical protein [Flavipsychrobacter sp.]